MSQLHHPSRKEILKTLAEAYDTLDQVNQHEFGVDSMPTPLMQRIEGIFERTNGQITINF